MGASLDRRSRLDSYRAAGLPEPAAWAESEAAVPGLLAAAAWPAARGLRPRWPRRRRVVAGWPSPGGAAARADAARADGGALPSAAWPASPAGIGVPDRVRRRIRPRRPASRSGEPALSAPPPGRPWLLSPLPLSLLPLLPSLRPPWLPPLPSVAVPRAADERIRPVSPMSSRSSACRPSLPRCARGRIPLAVGGMPSSAKRCSEVE